ncbi:MAG: glycosyltransferase family 4 protein [Patescibacteria group bacterium]
MTDKIRVASLINDMGIGGTARQVITVDRYLNKDIFEHYIISLSAVDDARSKFLRDKKVFFSSDPKEIAEMVKKNKIDIIYAHRHGRNESLHDKIAQALPPSIGLMELNTFSVVDKGDFGTRCGKRVFVSMTNLVKYCDQNNLPFNFKELKTVYCLVDANNFMSKLPTAAEIEEYKNRMGIAGCPVIGRSARPVIEKWDDEMLIMWKKLSKMNPRIKFLIYGVPPSKRKLLEASGRKDNLIMLGLTDSDKDLDLFYSSIDIYVHDSPIGECFGGTTVEAMLFKKPAIVMSTPFPRRTWGRTHTKDNGLVEQIKNGENGYVVRSGTAMAYAVDYLSQHPELIKKMGEKNFDEVRQRYEASFGIKTLEKIFLELYLEKNHTLPEEALNYYKNLRFYPDEDDIRGWFSEYYLRLANLFGKEYCNSALERVELSYSKYKRKAKTLLFMLGLRKSKYL